MAGDLLTFDEASHTYRYGDTVVPGVTSILAPLTNFAGIPPAILAAKADLGRRVHLACELLDDDDLDEDSIEDDVAGYLQAYRLFKTETRAEILLNEQRVFDPLYNFAGTLDRVYRLDGFKWLTDLKTCIATPMSAGPQTAAYMRALGDTTVTRRAALRLRPDGTYRFERLTDPDDWAAFVACLSLKRFLEKHQ